jgi:outer membrane murein-binding lipoprotein Lpp
MKSILAIILCLSLIVSGCEKKEKENDMESKKEKLIAKILQQPYGKDAL